MRGTRPGDEGPERERPPPRRVGPNVTGSPNGATASITGRSSRSRSPARSARQPVTTSRAPGRRCAAKASTASSDSRRASATKAQVFTTTRSASPGSPAGR